MPGSCWTSGLDCCQRCPPTVVDGNLSLHGIAPPRHCGPEDVELVFACLLKTDDSENRALVGGVGSDLELLCIADSIG